jgi:nucleotide-binding universal stress UspA family protein
MDRIVVAWDGSAQAARALAAALPFLARAEQVTVVTCEEAGDDGGLAEVTTYLAWHGIVAGRRAVPPHPGVAEALVAAAIGTDLLVMGGYSHSRLREMILGGVTRYMLEKAALPLLLMH